MATHTIDIDRSTHVVITCEEYTALLAARDELAARASVPSPASVKPTPRPTVPRGKE